MTLQKDYFLKFDNFVVLYIYSYSGEKHTKICGSDVSYFQRPVKSTFLGKEKG
jgi:hypothetical protein